MTIYKQRKPMPRSQLSKEQTIWTSCCIYCQCCFRKLLWWYHKQQRQCPGICLCSKTYLSNANCTRCTQEASRWQGHILARQSNSLFLTSIQICEVLDPSITFTSKKALLKTLKDSNVRDHSQSSYIRTKTQLMNHSNSTWILQELSASDRIL